MQRECFFFFTHLPFRCRYCRGALRRKSNGGCVVIGCALKTKHKSNRRSRRWLNSCHFCTEARARVCCLPSSKSPSSPSSPFILSPSTDRPSMEDKENSNPIQSVSPSGEAAAVANVSNLELHKSSGNNLMQFNSPDEQQGEPKTADQLSTPPPPTTTTTTSGGQSPKRPVLKEISVDLFGLISPDRKFTAEEEGEEEDKEGSPNKPGKASDLLSMSIFQTSPSTTTAAATNTTDNQKVNISTASSGETVSTVEQMSATAQDTSSSILSTSLLFNQSTATQPCDGDDSSFISTQLLFNQSLSLNRSQEATPGNESGNDSNSTINKTMQLSVISMS